MRKRASKALIWSRGSQGHRRPLAAEGPQELAVGDAVEPGPQRSLVLKSPQMPPGPDEGLLSQIFRQLRALREPEQVTVDARVVLAEEAVAGLGIAAPE